MDFQLTEEQQMIVDSLGKYVQNELEPISRECRDRLIPKEKMREVQLNLTRYHGVRPVVIVMYTPAIGQAIPLKSVKITLSGPTRKTVRLYESENATLPQ